MKTIFVVALVAAVVGCGGNKKKPVDSGVGTADAVAPLDQGLAPDLALADGPSGDRPGDTATTDGSGPDGSGDLGASDAPDAPATEVGVDAPASDLATGDAACSAGLSLCGGVCVDTNSTTAHCGACGMACGGGKICSGGACVCDPGQRDCGGTCVDVNTDATHCGTCTTACTAGQVCSVGICQATCATGLLV